MTKMIYILIGILILGGIIYFYIKHKKASTNSQLTIKLDENKKDHQITNLEVDNGLPYASKLNKKKELYPFKRWRENFFEYDMEQYTQENCDATEKVFDDLINELIKISENTPEKNKLQLFEKAINKLNILSEKEEALIETGEREDLCELIDQITIASGLNPQDYADGEGISDLWREW